MKRKLVNVFVWFLFVFCAVFQGWMFPISHQLKNLMVPTYIWPTIFTVSFAILFFQRKKRFELFGFRNNRWQKIFDDLMPITLFITTISVFSIAALSSCYLNDASRSAFEQAGLYFTVASGLVVAYLVSTYITKDRAWL